jgi:hypothetical protein
MLRLKRSVLALAWLAVPVALVTAPHAFGATGAEAIPPRPSNTGCVAAEPGWEAWGYRVPGHPVYQFDAGDPFDPDRYDFLGLHAKGNIIIGDYTHPGFNDEASTTSVVTLLDPGLTGLREIGFPDNDLTRPYIVDPSDAELGYANYPPTAGGLPRFDGNYNQQDLDPANRDLVTGEPLPAWKPDDGDPATPLVERKFYESSLSDEEFRKLVDPKLLELETGGLAVDAVLFTNHAIAGYVPVNHIGVFGSLVARDDALVYGRQLAIGHDPRLLGSLWNAAAGRPFFLPITLERPDMVRWEEVPVRVPADNIPLPSGQSQSQSQQVPRRRR